MLQQTQVTTVTPYFDRWMVRFPDVRSLAEAPLEAVLKAWEGLGYYARARNAHAAAQQILTRHGGGLPADRDALLRLPGIGRYTVGAILSLAFGQPEPVLDGNVRRVLCRLYDIGEDPRQPAVEKQLWGLADALVKAAPAGQYGDLNEGLMELGALVCTPDGPRCTHCPLAVVCRAHAAGVEAERPRRTARSRTPHYQVTAAIIRDAAGRYLITRRPEAGLLGGLWGFPGSAAGNCPEDVEDAAALAECLAAALHERLGLEVTVGAPGPAIRHAYTHFRITLRAFHCQVVAGQVTPRGYAEARWASLGELDAYAFPVTDRKILEWAKTSAEGS